jgi:hypothetical protein
MGVGTMSNPGAMAGAGVDRVTPLPPPVSSKCAILSAA